MVLSNAGLGLVWFSGEHDRALDLTERSVALNPNSAMGWKSLGWVHNHSGLGDRAVECFERAKRLSPLDPMMWEFETGIAHGHFHEHRYENAVRWLERAIRENPRWTGIWRVLAAAYAYPNRSSEARHAVERILAASPDMTVSKWAVEGPTRPGPARDHLLEGLRRAGLPE
jgi:adenylate cyclase